MSRFVSAGTNQDDAPPTDAWTKAREEVNSIRTSKPVEKGKQEDGKSLYEVLQANKAAKQEAFEEAAKLRNQFRALDDSEVRFLESVQDSEKAKEDATRHETAAQLELFRKQRIAAEQAAMKEAQTQSGILRNSDAVSVGTWTTSRKRRRTENADAANPTLKSQKLSIDTEDCQPSKTNDQKPQKTQSEDSQDALPTIEEKHDPSQITTSVSKLNNVGLVAYSSDDDD